MPHLPTLPTNINFYGGYDPDLSVELYLRPGSHAKHLTGSENASPVPVPGSAEDIATEGVEGEGADYSPDSPLSHLEAQDRQIINIWGDMTAGGIGFVLVFFPFLIIAGFLQQVHKNAVLITAVTLGLWGARISYRLHKKQRRQEEQRLKNRLKKGLEN